MTSPMMRKVQLRNKQSRPSNYRSIKITSADQVVALRQLGWREACLYQITSTARLAWFVYPNGMKQINILNSTHG